MIKGVFILLLAFATEIAAAQYKPVDEGSQLRFTVKNFDIGVDGTFKGLKGDITFDPNSTASSSFDVTIDATTVNTDNSLRDDHLRGDSYFDVKNYSVIRFVSTQVTGKNGSFKITGRLTIKKTTKIVSFPFSAVASNDGYVFKGNFSINRKDYDVGGTSTISDELTVSLSIAAKKFIKT